MAVKLFKQKKNPWKQNGTNQKSKQQEEKTKQTKPPNKKHNQKTPKKTLQKHRDQRDINICGWLAINREVTNVPESFFMSGKEHNTATKHLMCTPHNATQNVL